MLEKNLENKKNEKGFTLIEMLVVIAIIGALAAIIIPSVINYVHRACRAADKVTARLIGTSVVNLMVEYPEFSQMFYQASSMDWEVCIDGEPYHFVHVARADGSKACYGKDKSETGITNKDDTSYKQHGHGWEFIVDKEPKKTDKDYNKKMNSRSLTEILNTRIDEVVGGNAEEMSFIPMRSTGYKHPAEDANHDIHKAQDQKAKDRCKSKTYSYTDKWIIGYNAGKDGKKHGQVEIWAGDSYGKAATGPRVRLWPSPPSYY